MTECISCDWFELNALFHFSLLHFTSLHPFVLKFHSAGVDAVILAEELLAGQIAGQSIQSAIAQWLHWVSHWLGERFMIDWLTEQAWAIEREFVCGDWVSEKEWEYRRSRGAWAAWSDSHTRSPHPYYPQLPRAEKRKKRLAYNCPGGPAEMMSRQDTWLWNMSLGIASRCAWAVRLRV